MITITKTIIGLELAAALPTAVFKTESGILHLTSGFYRRLLFLQDQGRCVSRFICEPTTVAPTKPAPVLPFQAIGLCGMFFLTLLSIAPAYAQQSFENVAGSWSGEGSMKPSDGPRERIRCKVDYTVKSSGQSVKLNLRCASDAYKMELSANIDQSGSNLSGNWFESQYRQGGKISGQNINGLIEARVEGDTIAALLTVRTKGNRQTFVMESPGAWVSQVSIDLLRDSK